MGKWIAGLLSAVIVWWLTEGLSDAFKPPYSLAPQQGVVPNTGQHPPQPAAAQQPPASTPSARRFVDGRYWGSVLLTGVDVFSPVLAHYEWGNGATLDLFSTSESTFSGTMALTVPNVAMSTNYNVFEGLVQGNAFRFKAQCPGCADVLVFSGSFVAGNRIAGTIVTRGAEEARLLASRPPGSTPVPPGNFNLSR